MNILHQLARYGDISWLSYHFAEFTAAQTAGDMDDLASLSAARVCEANLQGSVCIDLEYLGGRAMFECRIPEMQTILRAPDAAQWESQLMHSDCVGIPGESTPLTLDRGRLYLNRFWYYENFVALRINALLSASDKIDSETLSESLMTPPGDGADKDQIAAVKTAVCNRFCVISGGPGSGKTSTVIRILSALLALEPDTSIALAAPTGKAAARMLESIQRRAEQVGIDDSLRDTLPSEASTIHRLLGYHHHRYDYNEQHPLAVDCVVVDEASMIDLRMMYHLLAALPDHARVILLGDRDQLASVAAGNVLGDITGHGRDAENSKPPVAASLALLRHNYRFGDDSPIGQLALAVNQGQSEQAQELLRSADPRLRWYEAQQDEPDNAALDVIYTAYQAIFDSESALDALDAFDSTRLLCATNHGPLGVITLNQRISSTLLARNNLPESEYYRGLPIMIVRNQHELGLFNGDTGILWPFGGRLRACFRAGDGEPRKFALNRLAEYLPAWAMTVHKSQGSEFDSVLLVLPSDPAADLLSRELLYTAITRAKRQFSLQATPAVIDRTIAQLTRRDSGLGERLGWKGRD